MSKDSTYLISCGRPSKFSDDGLNTPVSLNSTFVFGGDTGYARYGNDNCSDLEEIISKLERGKTLCFSSGMSAFKAIVDSLPLGSIVVASDQGYAGVNATLNKLHLEGKLIFKPVDISNTAEVLSVLDGATLLWIETPTNPMLQTADLNRLINSAHKSNVLVGVDNTFATPLRQKPLDLGADISLNSTTKYMAGHSDVLGGSISTNNFSWFEKIEFNRKISGTIIQPFDAWLTVRGIRTFALRFEKSELNAVEISNRLKSHDMVDKVYYPGYSSVISFTVKTDSAGADNICLSSRLVAYCTSLGGVESMWERRRRWELESKLVPDNLIRISVGCEDIEDLWCDIKYALES